MAEGYLGRSIDDLRAELQTLALSLAAQHNALADSEVRFRRRYWQAWAQQDPSLSAVARSKNSEASAMEYLAEMMQARGSLCATYEKLNLVRDLLGYTERREPAIFSPSLGLHDLTVA